MSTDAINQRLNSHPFDREQTLYTERRKHLINNARRSDYLSRKLFQNYKKSSVTMHILPLLS